VFSTKENPKRFIDVLGKRMACSDLAAADTDWRQARRCSRYWYESLAQKRRFLSKPPSLPTYRTWYLAPWTPAKPYLKVSCMCCLLSASFWCCSNTTLWWH